MGEEGNKFDKIRFRNVCLTFWNVKEEDNFFQDYTSVLNSPVTYYVAQGEYAENRNPHVQAYAEFKNQITGKAIKKFFNTNTVHIEKRRGTSKQASDYCKKANEYGLWHESVEFGTISKPGERTDLAIVINKAIDEGKNSVDQILENPEDGKLVNLCCVHNRMIDRVCEEARLRRTISEVIEEEFTDVEFRPWQKQLLEILEGPVDKRQVIWYYDPRGNAGKSFMSNYLMLCRGSCSTTIGKLTDMKKLYQGQGIVVIDVSRAIEFDSNVYVFAEECKNGFMSSYKYEVSQKIFKRPHVVVFSNNLPDFNKLSADRWRIIRLSEPVEEEC